MKKIWRAMLGASVGALSLAMLGGVGANAMIGAPSTLNYGEQSFEFLQTGEGIVSFDAVKVKGKGDSATLIWNANAKWDSYDILGADRKVDLSSRKTTKDLLVAMQDIGAPSGSTVFWVPADTSKYKGTYESGSITITNGSNKVEGNDLYQDGKAKFEYRTENGNWNPYNPVATKFTMYEQQGATLYFRRKAVEVSSSGYIVGRDKLRKEDWEYVATVYKAKAPYFASKEFKVKIPKRSNAPSVGVDYQWQTLKVKDTMEYRAKEYRTKGTDGTWVNGKKDGQWTEVPAGVKELKMSDLFEYSVQYDCSVEVRTKADPAKNKPASKACILKFPEVFFSTQNFGVIHEDGPVYGELPEKGFIVKVSRRKGKNYCKFINKNSDDTYEVYLDDPYKNKKAKKLAVVKKNAEVEVNDKKVPEQSILYLLISADKKKNRFRSNATELAASVVTYPKKDTE